jgi:hypothetical protein
MAAVGYAETDKAGHTIAQTKVFDKRRDKMEKSIIGKNRILLFHDRSVLLV